MTDSKLFFDSSVAFYSAGNIGYRWAVKVANSIAGRFITAETDAFFFLDIIDQYWWQKDYQGANTHLRFFRDVFPKVNDVTVEDFDRSIELFETYQNASPRLLLSGAVMNRIGAKKIVATFSAGINELDFLVRTNLMSELKALSLSKVTENE